MEAVTLTLERDPSIKISASQVVSAKGALEVASGSFDAGLAVDATAEEAKTPTGENTDTETRTYSEVVSWSKTLRSGQTLTPSINLEQTQGKPGQSTATVSFRLRQPLLRGREKSVVVAEERAAEHDLNAGRLDLMHLISSRLNLLASRYWTVRAAMLDLEILRQTEVGSRQLLTNTRRLVAAELTPAADLIQLEADLEFREVSTLTAERALSRAVEQLGIVIGLKAEEIERLPLPSDPFPDLSAGELPEQSAAYLSFARDRRSDLAAAKERSLAADWRLKSAQDGIKPSLDLVLSPSYTGFVAGDNADDGLNAITDNIPGLSALLTLNYRLPIGNRAAVGRQIQEQEAYRRSQFEVERQEITVGADVLGAMDEVRSNVQRLQKLERAVELFSRSLENESKKLRAGSSTLIDLLNQRDRLTSAQQRRVTARQDLATALADLRFKTGTMVRARPSQNGGVEDSGIQEIRLVDLTTLPMEEP